ncbi:MAG TPA: trypsin-like peptidase domain-containing protein [Pyrinomonadaceae bacterium]|nr:trypsin-like peptidase domain-containing protein [Pyrinomonadaceae bacterium]
MASGLVIHISAGEDRHTEVLTDQHIRIGSCDDCDLRLRLSNLPSRPQNGGVVLELERSNGFYRVTSFDPSLELTHNGRPVQTNIEIQDGDEVHIQPSNLELKFFPIRSLPAVVTPAAAGSQVAPFIEQAAIESAATARRDDAKVFLREFTRELVKEINPSTKLITLAIAIALVGGILYIGFAMVREVQRSRSLISDQGAQLQQMKDQVAQTNEELAAVTRSNAEMRNSLSVAVKVRSDFGGGVGLIAGSYYFVEAGTGRPLRYPEVQLNESGEAIQSAGESPVLTPEGKAPIAEYEFSGTGFYVGEGFVVTNRHIAQPWIADERALTLNSSVRGQPRLKTLNAYFPDHPRPIPLKFKMASQRDDLAVCTIDLPEVPKVIRPLPLETDPDALAVGKTVVMMGYPSGIDRLLALLDDAESRGILQRYGALDPILAHLAENRRIQPLTTQGNITDLDPRRIVYDARTAEGGSGAPLFGPSARVIGVNFAVFTENQASNFAVPSRFLISLLERAGWKPPTPEGKENEIVSQNTNATPTGN